MVGPPKIGNRGSCLPGCARRRLWGSCLGNVKVDDRPVLYLALEDGDRRLQDRCRTLLGEDAIPKGFEYLTVVTPVLIVPTIEQWMQRYAGLGPLVILDTLGKVAAVVAWGICLRAGLPNRLQVEAAGRRTRRNVADQPSATGKPRPPIS